MTNKYTAIEAIVNTANDNVNDIVNNVGTALNFSFDTIEVTRPTFYKATLGLPGVVYNPYNSDQLIIFFHGVGERGNGTTYLAKLFRANLIDHILYDRILQTPALPFESIVFAPQSPTFWTVSQVHNVVQAAIAEFNPSRVILMGYSAGGVCVDYCSSNLAANKNIYECISFSGVSDGTTAKANQMIQNNIRLQLWHTVGDTTVRINKYDSWEAAANQTGLTFTGYRMPGGSHAMLHFPFKGWQLTWQSPKVSVWPSINITNVF